ncbi:hypothetical protein [Nocardioides daphniae]|nr:hypothetical protein [Nocardioides daphniae]
MIDALTADGGTVELLVLVAVMVGAFAQGATGMGFSLVAARR